MRPLRLAKLSKSIFYGTFFLLLGEKIIAGKNPES
jgi:hypothetical protein